MHLSLPPQSVLPDLEARKIMRYEKITFIVGKVGVIYLMVNLELN